MRRRVLLLGVLVVVSLFPPTAFAQQPDTPCTVPVAAPAPDSPRNSAHDFATGAGVRVAVIDTGVSAHEQLGSVVPGGDLVAPASPDPLFDCDGHGTAVAGVIASRDAGIAPDAEIIAVRQTSDHYRREDSDDPSGSLATLTDAIHLALDHDADVINISVVACVPAHVAELVDTRALTAALRRAEEQGTVVVAASGNETGACLPGDVVYPAHLPRVIAVGGLEDQHTLAEYSLPAPEEVVQLSAAGTVPVALGVSGWASGLQAAGADPQRDGVAPFSGTSFAAPVVSGTVALLKERYPQDSAADLRRRIAEAAQPHHGVVDPYAALTYLPAEGVRAARQVALDAPDPGSIQARERSLIVLAAALALLLAAAALGGVGVRTSRGPASRRRGNQATPGRRGPRTPSPGP